MQYLGDSIDYWSGFYSTKPVMKQRIREMFRNLRNSNKLIAFTQIMYENSLESEKEIIDKASKTASILTHHDAITGTHVLKVK